MLLGGVHVGADEDAVEDAAAELLVDEALVVLKEERRENVGNVGNGNYFLKKLIKRSIFLRLFSRRDAENIFVWTFWMPCVGITL